MRDSGLLLAYAFRGDPPADLARFRRLAGTRGPLGPLTAACFLLYSHTAVDEDGPTCVDDFLFTTAPRLLHQLSRTTQPQRVLLHGRVRGRIDWSSTYKARHAADGNPTLFVCTQSWRRFDRPENQLFKFLLDEIQVCLDRALPAIQDWRAWGAGMCSSSEAPVAVGPSLGELAHRLRAYTGHVYLSHVSRPATIGVRHLAAARTSKNELYAEAAALYELYRAVVGVQDWSQWSRALNNVLPLPPAAGEIGRLLALTPERSSL
jgi:hypothetical protein